MSPRHSRAAVFACQRRFCVTIPRMAKRKAKRGFRQEHRTVRRTIRTDDRTRAQLRGLAGACRWVWNEVLEILEWDYKRSGSCNWRFKEAFNELGQPGLAKLHAGLRKAPGNGWLWKYSSHILRASLMPMETAFREFFKYIKSDRKGPKRGLPKFKSKRRCKGSIPLPDGTFEISGSWRRLRVQGIGWLSLGGFGAMRPWLGSNPEVCGSRIKEEAGKWILYLVLEVDVLLEVDVPIPLGKRMAGVDRNVGQVAYSDGLRDVIATMPDTSMEERRERRHLRRASKRYKAGAREQSKGYWEAMNRAMRWRHKRKRMLMNWRHHLTAEMVRFADVFVLEDLDVLSMTARGGRRKRRLNRGIRNTGWGLIERMLLYKARGLIKVDPAYTSQRCSVCSHTERGNRSSRAEFVCRRCDHEGHADVNAARNILTSGRGLLTDRGGCSAVFLADAPVNILKESR